LFEASHGLYTQFRDLLLEPGEGGRAADTDVRERLAH
jgi:hypothetical protein